MKFLTFLIFPFTIFCLSLPNINEIQRSVSEISKLSEKSPCIHREMQKLKLSCEQMSDSQKRRTALIFTNCLLSQSSKEPVQCQLRANIDNCLSRLQGDSWTSFSNFYIHVDSLCYYYSSMAWSQNTGKLINDLSSTTQETKQTLKQNMHQTEYIINIQKQLSTKMLDSISLQQELSSSMKSQHKDILFMSNSLSDTINSLQQNVNKHYRVITEVFNSIDSGITNLNNLQFLILGQIQQGIGSIAYYFILFALLILFSIMSQAVAQNFLRNFGGVLLSIIIERISKYFGFNDVSWNIRFLFLFWLGLSNLRAIYQHKGLQKQILTDILSINANIDYKMGSDRMRKLIRSSRSSPSSSSSKKTKRIE